MTTERSDNSDRYDPENLQSLSIIIPHYNDLKRLRLCLDAVEKARTRYHNCEIFVVDNGSDVSEAELVRIVDSRAKLLRCSERGAGPARNVGVDASTGEILAFIDSDCLASEHWVSAGIAALQTAGVVGGHVSVFPQDSSKPTGAEAYEIVFGFNIRSYVEDKGFVGSGNMFVRRADFLRVGGFRKTVSEDVEWSRRARANGLSLAYSREAEVAHPAREDWEALVLKFRRIHAESYALIKQMRWGRSRWLIRTWLMPMSIIAHAPRLVTDSNISSAAARLKGLGTLMRLRMWRFVDGHRILLTDALSR